MENWKSLYKELADKIADNVESIKWIDLWNSQVYNLEGEHPFPAPAVFLAFRSNSMQDIGGNVQKVILQVDVFLFYETFLDTFKGAYNQNAALEFLDSLDHINKLLHGSSGENYNSMSRVSFSPVDTGGSGNLYTVTYNCTLSDYSASTEWQHGSFADVEVEKKEPFIIP